MFEWLYDFVGACTLIGVYNRYSEVLAGIVARLVEMIPRWMIFNKRLLIDSGILLEKHYVKADS